MMRADKTVRSVGGGVTVDETAAVRRRLARRCACTEDSRCDEHAALSWRRAFTRMRCEGEAGGEGDDSNVYSNFTKHTASATAGGDGRWEWTRLGASDMR